MSQPPFQPPPPPGQPPQPPQNSYNPYSQPAPPQQAPGFGPTATPQQHPVQAGPPPVPGQAPVQAGPPPVPGQAPMYPGPAPVPGQPPIQQAYPMQQAYLNQQAYPMQAGPPFQAPPFGQQPSTGGNPVGALFLGLLVSFVVSALLSGIVLATYKHLTFGPSTALYLAHAVLNGALVGAVIGKVGHRSNGARIGGAVIAALGAFFGWANALPLIFLKETSWLGLKDLLEAEPFFPAKAWWTDEASGGVDWTSPLGLVLAAAAAWGIAYAVGNKRRQG